MMLKLKWFLPLLLVLLFSFPRSLDAAAREDMLDIAKELHPPGCTDSMTADYCTLYTAYELRIEISNMLDQGKNKDQIIEELVQKYGDRILAAPKAEGFHILAWVLPGAAVIGGGTLIALLVSAWVKRSKSERMETTLEEQPISDEEQHKVDEQLKQWI
jgi:cytochrome c-type biogenesis protein CcmH